MIESLLRSQGNDLALIHVPMRFSARVEAVGRFSPVKLAKLLGLVLRILIARCKGATVLYYPPASPHWVPVLRDVVALLATRWAFHSTVFHFHAAGLGEFLDRVPKPLRWLLLSAYRSPDVTIRLAGLSPSDGRALGTRLDVVIPNGIPDVAGSFPRRKHGVDRPLQVLFVGALRESKGVLVVLESMRRLRATGRSVQAELVGDFGSADFAAQARAMLDHELLNDCVRIRTGMSGAEKWRTYARSDIFCFPTHYAAENMSLVVLEAMQFGLPVVTTQWRALPAMVEDGVNGFLVPTRDANAVARRLAVLLDDCDLRTQMGSAGRQRFLERHSEPAFHQAMTRVLLRTGQHRAHGPLDAK